MKVLPGIVYEENLLWIPYSAEHTSGHAWVKILGKDQETGAAAALVKYEAGYKAPKAMSTASSEALYIQGMLVDGNKMQTSMTYEYRPPGTSFGPLEAREETVKFVWIGGKGENGSSEPVYVQNVDTGPWEGHPYTGISNMLARTLRVDKQAPCVTAWHVAPKVALTYPNKSMVHDCVEEVFCVDGENIDYYGDVEGFVKWRRGAYFNRPPFLGRHGHSLKTRPPFKVIVRFGSLKEAEPHDIKEGIESTFKE